MQDLYVLKSLVPHTASIGELKQLRQRRLQKRHLKSEFALPQAFPRLFHLGWFVKCWQLFWIWILKDFIKVEEKKNKVVVLCYRPQKKREIRHFHVVVVQRRLRNGQKSVMHVQSCCFANLNLLLFLPFSSPLWSSSLLKGTGSLFSACSLIKLCLSNLLLIVSVNNPTHIYLSDLRVYFKVEVYFRVMWSRWRSAKIAEKLVDYANTTNVEFIVDPKVLFHGWLIYSCLHLSWSSDC